MKRIVVLVIFSVISFPAYGEIIYHLLPGSTIRPMAGADFTGPAEVLTGTFQWDIYEYGGQTRADASYLYFESEFNSSFTLFRLFCNAATLFCNSLILASDIFTVVANLKLKNSLSFKFT